MAETVNIIPATSPWSLMQAQQQPAVDPQSYEAIQQQLNAFSQGAAEQQNQQALANLGMQKALTEAETPVDLSSVMSLADSWAGPNSRLAANYKVPETALQRRQMLSSLQNELNKTQGDMNQNQISLLKAKLETQARKDDREAQRDLASAIRGEKKAERAADKATKKEERDDKFLVDAQKRVQSDPVVTDTRKKLSSIAELKRTLAGSLTNPQDRKQLSQALAKAKLGGQISDTDVAAYAPGGSAPMKLDQFITDLSDGILTPENYENYAKIIDGMEANALGELDTQINLHANQYAKVSGKDPKTARDDIFPVELGALVKSGGKKKETSNAAAFNPGDIYTDPDTGIKYKFRGGETNKKENWTEVK